MLGAKCLFLNVLYAFASHVNLFIYIYIYIYILERRKILKDEVQQDGKNANTSQPGIEPGLQQTRLVLYQLSSW